jgi:hypothetical protein
MIGTRLVKRLSIGAYLGLARFCFALKPAFGLTGLKNQQFVRAFFLPRRAQDARARSAVTSPGWRWIVEAHREGRRYMVHSDELLSAFLELGAMLRERRRPGRSDRLRPSLQLHSFKRGICP